jgi:hypothetical protein
MHAENTMHGTHAEATAIEATIATEDTAPKVVESAEVMGSILDIQNTSQGVIIQELESTPTLTEYAHQRGLKVKNFPGVVSGYDKEKKSMNFFLNFSWLYNCRTNGNW